MDINDIIVDCIDNNKPLSFSKYGDGEFFCAFGYNGHNCDNDNYTPKLRDALLNSFKYIVEISNNNYIGYWHSHDHDTKWYELVDNKNIKSKQETKLKKCA